MYVKPKQGRVIMPDRKFRVMPEEGAEVVDSPYYRRLLRYGDIVEARKPRPQTAKAKAKRPSRNKTDSEQPA